MRRGLADRAVRWYAGLLARRALTAAAYGNRDGARKLTVRAVRRGPIAVERLVAVWTEAALAGLPRGVLGREGVRPVFLTSDFALVTDADRKPPPVRWVGRVLAAAANRDHAMCEALVAAVPAEELHEHLADLLRMASEAVVARDDVFWP